MFPQPHLYLNFGGSLGPAQRRDTWSVGIRMGQPDGYSAGELPPLLLEDWDQQLIVNLVETVRGFVSSTSANLRSDAAVSYLKANQVGREGKYVSTSNTNEIPMSTGGRFLGTFPQQVALASTYRTSARRGLASRGRSFWPIATGYDPSTGGVSATEQSALAGAVAGFLGRLGETFYAGGFALQPCVMSNIGDGAVRRIERVEVGSRFDIQRRRDNAEDETYVGTDVGSPVPTP